MNTTSLPTWRAWAIWSLGACFFYYAFLQRTAPSALVPDLMRSFDVSASALGSLSAFYFCGYTAVQLPTGLMADRWGSRRLLTFAALASAFGGLLFASTDSIGVAGMGRLLVGAGAGFGFICTLRIATDWFPPKRLALLTGMTMMLGMLGGFTGQAPLALAVAEFGWRASMITVASFGMLIGLGTWLMAQDRRPDGTSSASHSEPVFSGLKGALKRMQTWVIAIYGFFIVPPLFAFGTLWAVPFLQQAHGMTGPDAALSASLVLIGWGIFSPIVGWLSDRFKRRKPPMLFAAIFSLLSIVPIVYMQDLSTISIKALMFLNGVAVAGMAVSFAAVQEHNDSAHSGTSMAFHNMSMAISGAIMQTVIGWLLDESGLGTIDNGVRIYPATSYEQALTVLPVSSVAALLVGLMIKETHAKPQV